MPTRRELIKAFREEAESEGAKIVELDTARRLPHLVFQHKGKTHRMSITGSASDWRWIRNNVGNFRRALRECQNAPHGNDLVGE